MRLSTRSRCDECDRIASIECDDGVFLCEFCDALALQVLSNSASSVFPKADDNATVAVIGSAPIRSVTVATLCLPTPSSMSPGASANCGEASVSSLFSSPTTRDGESESADVTGAVAGRGLVDEFDPEIEFLAASLLAQWRPGAEVKNSMTLRVAADNLIHASASSSTASIPST